MNISLLCCCHAQDTSSPPVSFGNDDAAEDALLTGAVLVDR